MASTFIVTFDRPAPEWDAFVAGHPDGHTLQLAAWGELKSRFGWAAGRVAVTDGAGRIVAGAGILFRRLPMRLGTMAYIPAGPLFAETGNPSEDEAANRQLWSGIHRLARQRRAAFIKIEPCNWYRPRPDLPGCLEREGFRPSPQTVQPPRTVVLDISVSEDEIRKRMNQSTRYKSKLGVKKEVDVRIGTQADVASFNRLMHLTGARDGFGVHDPAYYEAAHALFSSGREGTGCALLMASHAGQDLAGVMVFRCGANAYYFYGASSNEERDRMATYIVQWEGIRWAKSQGATRYDLWGIPDADEEELEAQFQTRSDGLWGVYGFKRGFGGQVTRSVGPWDKPYNRLIYAAYLWYLRRRASQPEV